MHRHKWACQPWGCPNFRDRVHLWYLNYYKHASWLGYKSQLRNLIFTSQFLTSHTTRTTAGHHDNVHFHLFHPDGDHGQHAFHKLWSCSWVKKIKVWKERPKVCQEEPEKVCKEARKEVQKERRSGVCKEEETWNEACDFKAEQDEWKTKHRL